MKDKPQNMLFLCRVTYFHSFDTFILKIRREISKLKLWKYTYIMGMLQFRKIFPRNNDVVSPDYDISPSCRFSHGTAQLFLSIQNKKCRVTHDIKNSVY